MPVTQQQLFSEAQKQQAMADMLQNRALQQRGPQQNGPVTPTKHWGEGLAQLGEAMLARRASKKADEKFSTADEARRKEIADAIAQFGGGDYQTAQGAIDAGVDPALIGQWMKSQQPQGPVKLGSDEVLLDPNNQYSQIAAGPQKPQALPTDVQEYEYAKQQGYPGTFQEFVIEQKKAGAVNVDARNMGNIPAGYEIKEEGGTRSMQPIPGSPAAVAAQQFEEKTNQQRESAVYQNDLIAQEIDRAIETMDTGILPDTGWGAMLSKVPGTDAKKLQNLLKTIKSNVGFEQLQKMRNESPTGGALGNVSDREVETLQAVAGSLEQSQNKEELEYNLNRMWNARMDVIHGPGNGPPRRELARPEGSEQIQTDDPLSVLTPEQRARYGLN